MTGGGLRCSKSGNYSWRPAVTRVNSIDDVNDVHTNTLKLATPLTADVSIFRAGQAPCEAGGCQNLHAPVRRAGLGPTLPAELMKVSGRR